MQRSRQFSLMMVLAILTLVVACAPAAATPVPTAVPSKPAAQPTAAPAAPKPAATTAPAAAQPTTAPAAKPAGPVATFDYVEGSYSAFYTSSYVALDQGFFQKEGVKPTDFTTAGSSAAVVQALVAGEGSAVIAPAGLDAFVLAIEKNAPLKVIGALTYLPPYELIVQPNISKVEDLKGKTCVQSSLTSGEAPFLKALMAAHGLKYPDDYTIVVGGAINERIAAMTANSVQCTMIPAPQTFQLMDQGKKSIGKASDAIKAYQFISLGVNNSFAAKNRDVVVKALRAMIQAQAFAFDTKNREAVAKSLVTHKAAPEQYALRLYDAFYGQGLKVQVPELKLDLEGMNAVIAQMKADGNFPKDQTPDWKKYVDTSFWEEATGKKLPLQ